MLGGLLSRVPVISSVLTVERDGDDDEYDVIALNVEAVRALLPNPPSVPWRAVADVCGSAFGVVHATVCAELETSVKFFAELEFSENEGEADDGSPHCYVTAEKVDAVQNEPNASPDSWDATIKNATALPEIIVTPCTDDPPRPSDPISSSDSKTSCRSDARRLSRARCIVPLQDACFGNRLCVPAHPVVNDAFPPLVRAKGAPPARRWEYLNGHWIAILPPIEEQVRRGFLSRSTVLGARSRRRPAR